MRKNSIPSSHATKSVESSEFFIGKTVEITVELSYIQEALIKNVLNPSLPKAAETANYIVATFFEQGNLGQLFALIHGMSPSKPKFEIGQWVKSSNNRNMPSLYIDGEYHYANMAKVVSINYVKDQVYLEGMVNGKVATAVTGNLEELEACEHVVSSPEDQMA